MIQLTLIALYGPKPEPLRRFIAGWQQRLSSMAGAAFVPYNMGQVHATLVGLEAAAETRNINASFLRLRGRTAEMNLPGYLDHLRSSPCFPIQVQVGGYADFDYPFTSRGLRPYQRSFSIQADKVVVMGWPVEGPRRNNFPATLDQIRRGAQEFGILHSYHAAEGDVDNDFFFRLGTIDPAALPSEQLNQIERDARRALSEAAPMLLPVTFFDLHLAAYEDNRLPLATTRTCPVSDPEKVWEFIESLNR